MADTLLEDRLRLAGRGVAYPATPDLESAVMAALPVAAPSSRWRFPRVLAVAAAVAVLVAFLSLPGPRRAVADLLGIGGVAITMVDELPPAEATAEPWGTEVSLAEAEEAAGFDLLLPEGVGDPDAVFVDRTVPLVTLAYGAEGSYRLVVTEMLGSAEPIVNKDVAAATTIQAVTVGSADGYWISGAPHAVLLEVGPDPMRRDLPRLVGNTLIYVEDGITIRIETAGDLDQALDVAASLD